jgi:hypothetical protein
MGVARIPCRSEPELMCVDRQPDPELVNYILDNNLTEQFSLLRGAPGICLEPVSWETIKEFVEQNTEQSLAKLGRHPSGIVSYRRYRKQVSQFLPEAQLLQ